MKKITLLFFLLSISCFSQIDENLLLYYKFEGNALDATENGFDGFENNISYVADRFGNENSAAYFNGLDSFIDFPNLEVLKPQLPVSFSFWIKYDSTLYTDTEVFNTSFEEDESSGIYFNSQISTGNYAVNFGDGSPFYNPTARRTYTSNYKIDADQWHQVIVVVKASLDMEIYIDCKEYNGIYSGSGGDLFYSLGAGSLGRNDRDLGVPANYFKGKLDDFRYWDKALSEEEIKTECELLQTSDFLSNQILVYPNPAQNLIHIQADNQTAIHLNVFDNLGRLVLSTYFKNTIDVSSLSNGHYFLRFSSNENVQTKKLIISR